GRGAGNSSWESAHSTISLDKFIASLQTFMEEQPHEGYVLARCGEFASDSVVRRVLGTEPSLPMLLAAQKPADADAFPQFWGVYERETGATRTSIRGQGLKTLQVRMVRAFKNYDFAREAWHYVVVPALFGLPRAMAIRAASGRRHCMMPAPVQVGQRYYVDKAAYAILTLPPELEGRVLTGVMTYRRDRGLTGSRGFAFLTFTLTRPAVVFVCYDERLLATAPVWLTSFEPTGWIVTTSEGRFEVWYKWKPAGVVNLGCNEGWRKGCANYFVLLAPAPNDPGGGTGDSGTSRHGNGDAGSAAVRLLDEGFRAGTNCELSPHWLLREQSLAGGKVSLMHAIQALVEDQSERRRSWRLRQLVLGGSSRARYDAAAAAAGDRGLELAPVRFEYSVSVELAGFQLAAVDPISQRAVQTELSVSRLSAAVALEHLHPGDWLGRPDCLRARLRYELSGSYFNPLVGCTEHVIEPWAVTVVAESPRGAAVTAARLRARNHMAVNVTSALVDGLKSLATLAALNWTACYAEDRPGAAAPAGAQNNFVVRNQLGAGVWVYGAGLQVEDGRGGGGGGSGDDTSSDGGAAPGEELVCILPPGGGGFGGEAPPLTVHVPGFDAVRCIRVGVAGVRIYPLYPMQPASAPPKQQKSPPTTKSPGTAVAAAAFLSTLKPLSSGGAFSADAGNGRRLADFAAAPAGAQASGRVPKAPTLEKRGGSDGSSAESSGKDGLRGGGSFGSDYDFAGGSNSGCGGGSSGGITVAVRPSHLALVVEVHAGESGGGNRSGITMDLRTNDVELPLPLLLSKRLRLRGDGVNAWDAPIQLTAALLDPSVPNALRRTQAMETNSLVLQFKDPRRIGTSASSADGLSSPARGVLALASPPPARGLQASPGHRGLVTPTLSRSPSWASLPGPAADTGTGAADDLRGRSGCGGGGGGGGGGGSGVGALGPQSAQAQVAVEWTVIVHPCYTLVNVLPCAVEVQLLQPLQAGVGGDGGRADGAKKRDAAVDLFFLPQTVQAMEQAFGGIGGGGGNSGGGGGGGDSRGKGGDGGGESRRELAQRVAKVMRQMKVKKALAAGAALPSTAAVAANAGSGNSGEAPEAAGTAPAVAPAAAAVGSVLASPNAAADNVRAVAAAAAAAAGVSSATGIGSTAAAPSSVRATDATAAASGTADPAALACVWVGTVDSGGEAKIKHVATDRPLYVRLRIPNAKGGRGGAWCDALAVSAAAHANRLAFTSQSPEELTWETSPAEDDGEATCDSNGGTGAGALWRGQAPQIKAARSWGRQSSRRLTFYADYWIVNKTGMALWYRTKLKTAGSGGGGGDGSSVGGAAQGQLGGGGGGGIYG
ncbi:unnamed protein product, partial [Phaeothamnion confervicola]